MIIKPQRMNRNEPFHTLNNAKKYKNKESKILMA